MKEYIGIKMIEAEPEQREGADGSYVVGWLASQTDMLADDWCIVA